MSKKALKGKKLPMRTCIACRNKACKFDMVRVVRTSDGDISVDPTGKVRGRGVNFCEKLDCFEKAIRKGLIENALELGKRLDNDLVESLKSSFQEVLYQREFRRGKSAVTLRVKKNDLIDVLTK